MKKRFIVVLSLLMIFSFSVPAFANSGETVTSSFNIVDIFVPSNNYFDEKISDLNAAVNKKLGGIGYLYQVIKTFFSYLNNPPSSGGELSVIVPDNFIPGSEGITLNLFSHAAPFVDLFRGAVSCFIILVTAISCYKHLIKLFEK